MAFKVIEEFTLASPDNKGALRARTGHFYVHIPSLDIVVVGFGQETGTDGCMNLRNDIWKYDFTENKWSLLKVKEEEADKKGNNIGIQRCSGATAVLLEKENKIYVFGGAISTKKPPAVSSTLYEIDLSQIKESETVKETFVTVKKFEDGKPWPAGRSGHVMAVHNNDIIVWGGRDGSGNILNDFWKLSTGTNDPEWRQMWTQVPGRTNTIWDNSGQDDLYVLDEERQLFKFSWTRCLWEVVSTTGPKLKKMSGASMISVDDSNSLLVCGLEKLTSGANQFKCCVFDKAQGKWSTPNIPASEIKCDDEIGSCVCCRGQGKSKQILWFLLNTTLGGWNLTPEESKPSQSPVSKQESVISALVDRLVRVEGVTLGNLAAGKIEALFKSFAASKPPLAVTDRFVNKVLVSLLPDLVHMAAITLQGGEPGQIVKKQSVKEVSVLTLVRYFLDACAFFNVDTHALAFLTNFLMSMDLENHGRSVSKVETNMFCTHIGANVYEKVIRMRFCWLMNNTAGVIAGDFKDLYKEGKESVYFRKQLYISALEMAKNGDWEHLLLHLKLIPITVPEGITVPNTNEIVEIVSRVERMLEYESDIFAQAALVRVLPYVLNKLEEMWKKLEEMPKKLEEMWKKLEEMRKKLEEMPEKFEDMWNELYFQSKLALALECHEESLLAKKTDFVYEVFKKALMPIEIGGKKEEGSGKQNPKRFYSKSLARLGEKGLKKLEHLRLKKMEAARCELLKELKLDTPVRWEKLNIGPPAVSFDPIEDLRSVMPYNERFARFDEYCRHANVRSMEILKRDLMWIRSPIHVIREKAIWHFLVQVRPLLPRGDDESRKQVIAMLNSEFQIGNMGTRHSILTLVAYLKASRLFADDRPPRLENVFKLATPNKTLPFFNVTTEIIPNSPLDEYWRSLKERNILVFAETRDRASYSRP